MPRIVIVGGGISGLALAYRLQAACPQAQVTVLERASRPGGTCWTEARDGFRIELGPNGFLDTKPSTIHLCRDLGLSQRLLPARETARKNRFVFLGDRLRRLPDGLLAFVRSDLLSWRGKLNVLAERWRPYQAPAADEAVAAFFRRRFGKEVEVLVDALVTGIHGGDPALLSLAAAFPRVARLAREHGGVLKGFIGEARRRRAETRAGAGPPPGPPTMWSFAEGLRVLSEGLAEQLAAPPLYGVTVRRLERETGTRGWLVRGEGKDTWPADVVVLACPAFAQAALLADVDAELADRIAGIAYNRIAVVALGYHRGDVPHPLDGFGYIVPQRLRRDLLGVQWCSSIYPERAPAGLVLLRALCGGWHRAEVVEWLEDRLLEAVRHELHQALGITAAPRFHHIVRWDRAIPQYQLGHPERVQWIERRLQQHPGLFVGGNAYHGVALNDCTERAEVLARQVHAFLQTPPAAAAAESRRSPAAGPLHRPDRSAPTG